MQTASKQLSTLTQAPISASFSQKLKQDGHFPLTAPTVDIFQMNVGKLCNLQCSHCHVDAGPSRTEIMEKSTFEQCLKLIESLDVSTIDLTGGSPEMNPHLEWFIQTLSQLKKRVIVRSNLTVLTLPKYAHFIQLFADHQVEVVASLPCYTAETTDSQRGSKVFVKSIEVLKKLNMLGYGKKDSGRVLNLVHNPVGFHLPGPQQSLEAAYKKQLLTDHDIHFNHLFCITNLPISRFLEALLEQNKFEDYMALLLQSYNPSTVEQVMCRNTLSISWDGLLYDCDFNQMLDLPIAGKTSIWSVQPDDLINREIVVNNHCFGCTAGSGSSCQGSLTH